jgi:Holliday junction resolvase
MNSREKGKRGERNLASTLRGYGYDTRRGQQFSGANGDADVVGLKGIHIECKWVEKLNVLDAMAQSKRDAKDGEIPVVMHKKNHTEWFVTMTLEDWIKLYREWSIL